MKKLFLVVIISIMASVTYGQAVSWFVIATKNIKFNQPLASGQYIIETDSCVTPIFTFYKLMHKVVATDSMKTVFRNGWYQRFTGGSGSGGGANALFNYSLTADGQNNFTVPFTLTANSTIFINGYSLRAAQWSGVGSSVLHVNVTTRHYDYVSVLK